MKVQNDIDSGFGRSPGWSIAQNCTASPIAIGGTSDDTCSRLKVVF